jgi:MoaA/NifB/PqqE/SkfB family radical SAM enzyme
MIKPTEFLQRAATLLTDRIHTLPVVILMPHSACNCRCVMCDIWKANRNKQEISKEVLADHLDSFRKLKVKWVVLSGGEALMHSNLWKLCEMLKEIGIRITILSTGLLLEKHANEVIRWSDEVTVSLDGSAEIHNKIRDIPNAYQKLESGIRALRELNSNFPVTGRCVLQRLNYFDLPNIIESALKLELNQISFFAADVSSTAFNRPEGWQPERVADVALTAEEVYEFREIIEKIIEGQHDKFSSGFIAESPDKMRKIVAYYSALNDDNEFPTARCNAPWVSTVIEADGSVRPCFFHRTLGNINDTSLTDILNSADALSFRQKLDVKSDPICRKCVCSLNLSPANPVVE